MLAEVYLELLGGRQTSMDLTKTHDHNISIQAKNIKENHNIHNVKITKKDIQEHKDFIADLKNALWHKVNY